MSSGATLEDFEPTLSELRDAFPQAMAEIEAEARESERERIRAIFALGDDASRRQAEYLAERAFDEDEPTARELAGEVMRGGPPSSSAPSTRREDR